MEIKAQALECWEIPNERSATLQFEKLKARKTATGPKSETDIEKDKGRQTQRDAGTAGTDMYTEKQRHSGRNGKNRERESESQKDKRVSKKEKDGKRWKSQTHTQS